MELQTIPLRFRVWDKNYKKFIEEDDWSYRHLVIKPNGKVCEAVAYTEYGGTQSECSVIEYEDISDDVVISQDTGMTDCVSNELFIGDIVDNGYETGVIEYEAPILYVRYGEKKSSNFDVVKKIGNIWQTPQYLEK